MPETAPRTPFPALEFLKQRYPMVMVDRVLALEEGHKIRTLKNITVNDTHFPGHFPDYPVFPGVLTIECFAQAAAILIRLIDGETPKLFDVIGSVMDFRFIRPLVPGDRLEVEMGITKAVGTNRIIEGKGYVGAEVVASGKFTFGKLERP